MKKSLLWKPTIPSILLLNILVFFSAPIYANDDYPNNPKGVIDRYIQAYLTTDYETVLMYEFDECFHIFNSVMKAPKPLQEEEFRKELEKNITKIKNHEREKMTKGANLKSVSTAYLYEILYPKVKYEILEIRESMAFVSLLYSSPQLSPHLNNPIKRIKSLIVKVFFKVNQYNAYQLNGFSPTNYKIELF